ncbi:MAG: DUF5050 domain-containing protein [Defluviitaleaceae bacterium]|nr:DUF5050 domain-containing protein [Defluviitaleaceae bacterium]
MALPIDVKPYDLIGSIGGNNYLSHYKAKNESGEEFIITEFFPAYMVKREDDGTLTFSERFTKEFIADREEFVNRAEALKENRDASLHPVVEIFEKNQTAYIVRRACSLTTVAQYMGPASMDYDEAYHFIRPLLLSMAQVGEKRMFFNITMADFRVNAYKQLVLSAPPAWEPDFHPSLTQVIKLYYRLVTGVEPPETDPPPFSAYGIEVPPRIESMVSEILGGDILFGSLDDFYRRLKAIMDGGTDTDDDSGEKTLSVMRGTAAVLFIIVALSIPLLVFAGVRAYRAQNSWANPEFFADSEAPPPPEHDFSGIMLTHPLNTADVVHGSMTAYDGFLFKRGEHGMLARRFGEILFIPGAAAMLDIADDRTVAYDAKPSFIAGHGRYVFFSDVNAGGRIYRVTATGGDRTQITDHAALSLAVIGDYLFYTHVDADRHLFRLNLNTNVSEPVYQHPVSATLASGSHLFFVASDAGGPNSLLVWDTASDDPVRRISTTATSSLRVCEANERIFYLDTSGRVQSLTFDGRSASTLAPENVRTFDVFFEMLLFTDDRHVPRSYNMNTGALRTLSTTVWASYLWAHDGSVYALDHRNPMLVHEIPIP